MSISLFFVIFAALIVIAAPMAVVFGGMSFLPGLLSGAIPYTVEAAVRSMFASLNSFTMLAVPLFMLSGIIMARGGISEKLFDFFAYFIGKKTAGLPCAVVLTCMFYGAISGSAPATVSAVGAMCIPFLVSLNYDLTFSTSIVAVAGGLGVIIPPSISYIVYAGASESSPADLFIAGIIPGVLIGACLCVCCYIHCKRGEDKVKLQENYDRLHEKGFLPLLKDSFAALLTPVIILGSIYGGFCSPTEAAAISVIYALIVSLFVYKSLKWGELLPVVVEGAKSYVGILFIIATAFGRVLTVLQYPQVISSVIIGTFHNKIHIILVMNLILLIFGMIMDNIPNIMILTPILLPIAKSIGMDPVHFGIMNICANNFYEVQDYVIETNHLGHIMVFTMNYDLYISLPEEIRALVDQCAAQALEATRAAADQEIDSYKATILASGTQIIQLDESALLELRQLADPVYDMVRADLGDELVDVFVSACDAAAR